MKRSFVLSLLLYVGSGTALATQPDGSVMLVNGNSAFAIASFNSTRNGYDVEVRNLCTGSGGGYTALFNPSATFTQARTFARRVGTQDCVRSLFIREQATVANVKACGSINSSGQFIYQDSAGNWVMGTPGRVFEISGYLAPTALGAAPSVALNRSLISLSVAPGLTYKDGQIQKYVASYTGLYGVNNVRLSSSGPLELRARRAVACDPGPTGLDSQTLNDIISGNNTVKNLGIRTIELAIMLKMFGL